MQIRKLIAMLLMLLLMVGCRPPGVFAQESTGVNPLILLTEEEPAATEDVNAPAPDVTVVIESSGDDSNDLLLFLMIGAGLVISVVNFVRTGKIEHLQNYFERVTNLATPEKLGPKFARLEPEVQDFVTDLVKLADPATKFFPGDMDDRGVQWLKDIILQAEAAKEAARKPKS